MKNTRLSQSRWHDKIVSNLGIEPTHTQDYSWMPLDRRRETAAELLASGWRLDYLERWYVVELTPNDFHPNQMTDAEKRTVFNAFLGRGLSRDRLANYFGKEAA